MIPGEVMAAPGELVLNEGAPVTTLLVANTGDRPVQVGSHYHFYETNPALDFDREAARGLRLEPGQSREVNLIPIGGACKIYGFNQKVMGAL